MRYRPSADFSRAPQANNSAARRWAVGRDNPARSANSVNVNSGVFAVKAARMARILPVTERSELGMA